MALGSGGLERRRFGVGMLVLSLGVALMLWAWGNWLYRASVIAESIPTQHHSPENTTTAPGAIVALARLLVYGFVVVIVVLLGSFVVVRAIRRNIAQTNRRPAEPTPAPEIWGAHHVDPDDEFESRKSND